MTDNPLLHPSNLPYGLPDFAAITLDDVQPAFTEALRRHAEEITTITTEPTPTWENTVEALERSGRELERVTAWFFNLQGTDGNEAFDAVADDIVPKLSAHLDSIYQNEELYRRLEAVEVPADEESQRLHDLLMRRARPACRRSTSAWRSCRSVSGATCSPTRNALPWSSARRSWRG